ncbi:MAG: glycosyltransferase family 2 protein [Pirellulales bacterium]|nr:glycosyltransferase family 2 protein [Pirellulales bacterium]
MNLTLDYETVFCAVGCADADLSGTLYDPKADSMTPQITVLIPCRDEERNIQSCIEAARLVADEILVADSGSIDRTLEIVKSQKDVRLIERTFVGYADFKNWAIPQATHPWVLIVDADERVTLSLAEEIRGLLESTPEEIDAYWIYRRNFFLGHEIKFSGWNTDDVCRLIRRDRCRYGRRLVHEEIDVEPKRTRWLRERLIHYTVRNYDHYLEKRIKYTELSAKHIWENGKRASFSSLFFRPLLRFVYLYVLRGGFRDGLAGLQICMLTAFFNTFIRQGRLWEMQHGEELRHESFETSTLPSVDRKAA